MMTGVVGIELRLDGTPMRSAPTNPHAYNINVQRMFAICAVLFCAFFSLDHPLYHYTLELSPFEKQTFIIGSVY